MENAQVHTGRSAQSRRVMTLALLSENIRALGAGRRIGYVSKVSPGRIESSGPICSVGDLCEITHPQGRDRSLTEPALAQVIAVNEDHIVLAPLEYATQTRPDSEVVVRSSWTEAPVGNGYAGRVVDALGAPMDKGADILPDARRPIEGVPLSPLQRRESGGLLSCGMRVIDGLLAIGEGQRIGAFAASGVGKTTLIRQLAVQADCDHVVLCLVGERGREVQEVWSTLASRSDIERFTLVAATSDASAVLRARAVEQALCLCEHWREQGRHVVLILDSVTRYAMALREVGLAAGAPPTVRAYTPNVFAALPRIVERCGALDGAGAVTAIMTVLSETDDVDDPIVETMKSLLDGHWVLSRQLAERGHFPAIDVTRSISRMFTQIADPDHVGMARQVIAQLAAYEEARVMIESGVYKLGSIQEIDEAIQARPRINAFLQQGEVETSSFEQTFTALEALTGKGGRS